MSPGGLQNVAMPKCTRLFNVGALPAGAGTTDLCVDGQLEVVLVPGTGFC